MEGWSLKKGGLWILFGFILYIVGIGVFFTNRIMFLKKKEDDFIWNREVGAKRISPQALAQLPQTKVKVPSPFGYEIDCLFVHPYPNNKWMIFCHGITENKYNSVKYMNLFIERGFNAIIYDHRRHGLSGGKTSSYGHYEKWDLKAVIDELKKREGNDVNFGIHGESMGAATALLYGGTVCDDASFYIVDCPFSDLTEQLKYRLKVDFKIPSPLVMPIADAFLKLREGYTLKDVSPITAINEIQNPILFIHSANDDFILADMTRSLYEQKQGPKQLFIATKGVHAQSLNENMKEYEEALDKFLVQYGKMH